MSALAHSPNKAASGNGAVKLLSHAECPGRAVPEQHRSATEVLYGIR